MQSMIALAFFAFLNPGVAHAQSAVAPLMIEEVKDWNGLWTGTLSYLDYTSEEMVTLDLNGNCYLDGSKLVLDYVINEWGKVYNQHYVYKIQNGTVYKGGVWDLKEKTTGANGALRFVITQEGRDGNDRKPCIFRVTFSYEGNTLSVTKEVKFKEDADFFLRNEYRLQRVGK